MGPVARALVRVAGLALLVDVVLAAGVGLLGLALGWESRVAYAEALGWSGLLAAAAGGLAVRGGWEGRLTTLGFAASAGNASLEQRQALAARDVLPSYRLLLFMLLVAAPLLGAAVWLDPRV